MKIKQEMRVLSTKLEEELKIVDIQLNELQEGRLKFENQHGKICPVKEEYVNGVRKRKNLRSDSDDVIELLRRRLLQEQHDCLTANKDIINKALSKIQDYDLNGRIYELKKEMKLDDDELFIKALKNNNKTSWEKEEYEKLNYENAEQPTKWQITTFGLKVRSKSELLIAEELYSNNIKFRYEQIIHIDSNMLAPDFTIMRNDGKMFYWEHEGLTNSKIYMNRQLKKSQIYASAGIVPWDNLIVTYDNEDGIIDLRIIESEIKNKLMI